MWDEPIRFGTLSFLNDELLMLALVDTVLSIYVLTDFN